MIFCVTSILPVGCTFLDWSIHFVTGQSKFYNTTVGWLPLTDNPLQSTNSHGHVKNHPSGLETVKRSFDRLEQFSPDTLASSYPQPLYLDACARALNIPIAEFNHPDHISAIAQYRNTDYNNLLQYSAAKAKVIFVDSSKHIPLYYQTIRSTDRWNLKAGPADSVDSKRDELDHVFFKQDIETWTEQGLTDVWDVRERRALHSSVIKKQGALADICVDFSFPHYWVDCRSLWFDGADIIQDIVNWIGLTVDPERFKAWLPIYHRWQKIQAKSLKFQFNYEHIVNCIVNNWSYPIDLTFDEEVVIQHCLIYQHNLNLKTWQLKKFPNNTQELHKLLEHNIHAI